MPDVGVCACVCLLAPGVVSRSDEDEGRGRFDLQCHHRRRALPGAYAFVCVCVCVYAHGHVYFLPQSTLFTFLFIPGRNADQTASFGILWTCWIPTLGKPRFLEYTMNNLRVRGRDLLMPWCLQDWSGDGIQDIKIRSADGCRTEVLLCDHSDHALMLR